MGTYYSVHLGPYVVCNNHKVAAKQSVRSCTNAACGQYGIRRYDSNVMFCDKCGSPIGIISVEKEQYAIDTYALSMNFKEMLFNPITEDNTDIWMPNRYRPGEKEGTVRPYKVEQGGDHIVPVSTGMIMDELQEFLDFYKEAVTELRKAYGEENVEIKWGMIYYGR